MKCRYIIFFTIAVLMALTSCATSARPVSQTEPSTSMANPMHSSSQAEIEEMDGIILSIPKGSSNDIWFRIYSHGTPVMDQVSFEFNSVMYIYRAQKTTELQDTSGMYFDWGQQEAIDQVHVFTTTEGPGIAIWFDDGISYSLAMTEYGTAENLMAMYHLVK